ncbi:MAG: hypothetical protein SCH71_10435 [Desulfobulbaceae bacterium]|nr:hypothetical protein [Desulfobulbaceae bacterium]
MDEGVDPTKMCQTLVDKVSRSKQLQAVTEPEILVLFENWLDELEEEVVESVRLDPDADPLILAEKLGLSKSGARFLIAKLQREDKI